MVTLTRSSSGGQWKAATNIQEELRFQDSREARPKVFELSLRQNLSYKISKCQDNCGRKKGLWKSFLLPAHTVIPIGLKQYDTSEFYGLSDGFDFSHITVDKDVQNDLNDTEIEIFRQYWCHNNVIL